MAKKRERYAGGQRMADMADALQLGAPQLWAWCNDVESFLELRIKQKEDGSVLVIAKGFSSDGTPVVCFGSGYGIVGGLLAINSTITGDYWREDKPWQP